MKSAEPVVALVVAAGSGVRLGGDVPKALRLVGGEPLVVHSVRQLQLGGCGDVVVVAASDRVTAFTDVVQLAGLSARVVAGGARRQDSVAAGLEAATATGARIVLVHDAARPLVPVSVVQRVITAVTEGWVAVVPALPVTDSIRAVDGAGSHVVDRSPLRAVQTPQGFDLPSLVAAHETAARRGLEVTDDAAVCEAAGHAVHVVAGAPEALKVTTPTDLLLAEAIWSHAHV